MEQIDDLILSDYKIYQSTNGFRFGTDAVLLYGMMPRGTGRTIDLCSGNGAVALLMLAGEKCDAITTVEIQSEGCRLCRKSAALNGCSERMEILCADIRKISDILSAESFDTVCVNPPYFKKGSGILPPDPALRIARHETECTVEDVFSAAAYLLREGGDLYMVHRRARRDEILNKIKKYGLSVVETTRVFSTPDKESELFLLHAEKSGRNVCVKESIFTVNNADRTLSTAYKSIYKGE